MNEKKYNIILYKIIFTMYEWTNQNLLCMNELTKFKNWLINEEYLTKHWIIFYDEYMKQLIYLSTMIFTHLF